MTNHYCPVFLLILTLLTATPAMADDLYVSPTGNDRHAGTKASPLASLAAARDKARSMAGKSAVTIHVADGVYYLPKTLVFKPCLLYTSPSPRDGLLSRMPSSA